MPRKCVTHIAEMESHVMSLTVRYREHAGETKHGYYVWLCRYRNGGLRPGSGNARGAHGSSSAARQRVTQAARITVDQTRSGGRATRHCSVDAVPDRDR